MREGDDRASLVTEDLRSDPRDAEAKHRAKKKDLLAKIGDLTMQMEAYKIARDDHGRGKTSARSHQHPSKSAE